MPSPANDREITTLLKEHHKFPLRSYNARVMRAGAIFFAGLAVFCIWGFGKDGDFLWAAVSFLIWGGAAFLLLRILRMNRQAYELTVEAISLTDDEKPVQSISWIDVQDLKFWHNPGASGSGWTLTLCGPILTKIEIDGDTPKFADILQLVQLHIAANGKHELVRKLVESIQEKRR